MKNTGIAVVLYVAITLLLVTFGGITQAVAIVLQGLGESETLVKVLQVIDRLNVGMAVNYIGMGTSYKLEDVLYLTLPALAGTLGFVGLGLIGFGKKDLK